MRVDAEAANQYPCFECSFVKPLRPFKELVDTIETVLLGEDYMVRSGVLSSKVVCGTPMERRRWYCVGIASRVYIGSFCWPEPTSDAIPLRSLVPVLGPEEWAPHPPVTASAKSKTALALGYTNVAAAYKEFAAIGGNPFEETIIVDVGCSEKFRIWKKDVCPTITRTSGGAHRFWDSVKGGLLSNRDMAKLMGFNSMHWPFEAHMTDRQFGLAIGNGCSVSTLNKLIPEVLYSAGSISLATKELLLGRAAAYQRSLVGNGPKPFFVPQKTSGPRSD